MGNRYYLTGVQLGILMSEINEKSRMELLNEIMNEQQIETAQNTGIPGRSNNLNVKSTAQKTSKTKLKRSKAIPSMLTDGQGGYYPDDSSKN